MTAKPRGAKLIANPKTSPPSNDKPYIAVEGPGGKEVWYELSNDEADLEPGDFDFAKGKKWASQQKNTD